MALELRHCRRYHSVYKDVSVKMVFSHENKILIKSCVCWRDIKWWS